MPLSDWFPRRTNSISFRQTSPLLSLSIMHFATWPLPCFLPPSLLSIEFNSSWFALHRPLFPMCLCAFRLNEACNQARNENEFFNKRERGKLKTWKWDKGEGTLRSMISKFIFNWSVSKTLLTNRRVFSMIYLFWVPKLESTAICNTFSHSTNEPPFM
jgi:hypothetical protein